MTFRFLLIAIGLASTGLAQENGPPQLVSAQDTAPLVGTTPLTIQGDLSRMLIEANDRFLNRQLEGLREKRDRFWPLADAGHDRFDQSQARNRSHLRAMIGMERDNPPVDDHTSYDSPHRKFSYDSPDSEPVAQFDIGGKYGKITVYQISWPVFGGIRGRGFLLEPETFWGRAVAIPDTSQNPIELVWPLTTESMDRQTSPFAFQLAMNGVRTIVPTRIQRFVNHYTLTDREWLHRQAYELGRTLDAYELHKLFAAINGGYLVDQNAEIDSSGWHTIGWGDGGRLALLATAVSTEAGNRFNSACISGTFANRDHLWQEPFDHQLFGFVERFGDAELARLVAPRKLVIENGAFPDFRYRPKLNSREFDLRETEYAREKGKPGRTRIPTPGEFEGELGRLESLLGDDYPTRITAMQNVGNPISTETLAAFLHNMGAANIEPSDLSMGGIEDLLLPEVPKEKRATASASDLFGPPDDFGHGWGSEVWSASATTIGSEYLRAEEVAEIERYLQRSLVESTADRVEFFSRLDTSSRQTFVRTVEPYREEFRKRTIGDYEIPLAPPNARTRPYQEGPSTISYEVVLDVFEEHGEEPEDRVIAYGILTLPKNLPLDGSEQRPVVVCQHGLEGTPQQLVGKEKFAAYKAFATRLAERGFITFAPQNGYKFFDLFRMQQFKAQSMGKTIFSIIVPQHEQITNWLASLPFVAGDRIGFYGLSYGGKSAMRIPPLVDRYCLSICSGDFNEWVWKNAATDSASLRYSYANKGEYEIFEWNLGGTFNYAEMAALICPRPFMVERGHFDGVAPDEKVAHEFAKVRNLYQAKLGIGELCEIEWFPGLHAINGEDTFRFLHRHLEWPESE